MNSEPETTSAEDYYYLGVNLIERDKLAEAEKALRKAIALHINIPEAYNYLAFILSQQPHPNLEEIANLFHQAITINPDFADGYYNLAIVLSKQGNLSDAIQAYLQVIRLLPDSIEAYYNLGVLFSKQKKFSQAQSCFTKVVELKPDYAMAYFNLGITFREQELFTQSAIAFNECIKHQKDYAPAYNSLGIVYKNQGNLTQAQEALEMAIATKPDYLEAYNNLAVVLIETKNLSEAEKVCRRAIEIKPDYAASYNVLGSILIKQQLLSEAVEAFNRAIALTSDYPEAYNNLAVVLTDLEAYEEAKEAGLTAIKLKPDYPEAYNNLAVVFLEQGNFIEAAKTIRGCLHIKPDYAEAYNNLGLILTEQRLLEPALAAFEQAIRLKPDYHKVRFTHACTHLLAGNLTEGFSEYESRWLAHGLSLPKFAQPKWDGSNIEGKTILLLSEQGLGDTLQFIRYAQLLHQLGAVVTLACQSTLVKLLSTMDSLAFVKTIETVGEDFDVYAPLLSLPHLLHTSLDNIPAAVPYISVGSIKSDRSISNLNKGEINVGIVWASGYRQGDANLYQLYKKKSCPVKLFMELLDIPRVNLYSLQVGKDAEDILPYVDGSRVINLSPQIQDFIDTAALIEQMDLVICVDTSVAHLAGAMGKPVWVLLYYTPDWRWLLGRKDTPWYPTMRLFRQSLPQDWESVFVEVVKLLRLMGGFL